MKSKDPNGDGAGSVSQRGAEARATVLNAQRASHADQSSADEDQSAADSEQTLADTDQTASTTDQANADRDQRASDSDQATADRAHAAHTDPTAAIQRAYDTSRHERESVSFERRGTQLDRASTAHDRDVTATRRDRVADARDEASRARDARARLADLARAAADSHISLDASLMQQLEELGAEAAADRARAATDRARAAQDRADAARERTRLEEELRSAHLDELTGAYRRGMGRLALSHEIDRARRSDGRFVLAFVDVDRLKAVNDRDGHAAGDRVLQTVVRAIQTRVRSFDPIIRYGGDEFLCGLSGTDMSEAAHRFESIGAAIEADAHVGISVGLAALVAGESADELTHRADAAMLEVKANHHATE